jgi:hypothetical protein
MKKYLSALERYQAKVQVGTSDECWPWLGGTVNNGYGMFWFKGRMVLAGRWKWQQERGPIPEGMILCHACDNPPCQNLDHMFLGTYADNTQDMMNKGRNRSRPAALTPMQANEVRGRYLNGGASQRQLAREYAVSQYVIGAVVRKETPYG